MRRTRASTNKSQGAGESVKTPLKTVWQWEGDDGQWEVYSPSACAVLDSGVSSGQTSVTLSLGSGGKYEIDLKKKFQINPVTKYKRKIRCQTVKEEMINEVVDSTADNETTVQVKEEEEVEQPAAKRKRGKSQANVTKEEIKSEEVVKTVVMKGKAPVDTECTVKIGKAHVYCEGNDVYDVMLNQTNLQFNNNKYYLIQLLEDDSSKVYSVWLRWGRVGKVGQNTLIACGSDLLQAKNVFKKKFSEKTKNEWDQRATFEKVPGKYDLVFMDYSTDENGKKEEAPTSSTETKKKTSKLDLRIQSLLQLICDLKAFEECVLEMKFDTQKAPLGKLTSEQISQGYKALKKIEECLKNNSSHKKLEEACNLYYTRIPHNFGLKRPPMIHTDNELKKEISLLEALSDIRIAVKMVQSSKDSDEHPLDKQYSDLHCKLDPVDCNSHEYKVIEQYLQSTHASTHNTYTMSITDIFSVDRDGENNNLISQLHNRTLLWHGSRLSNWVGILSQGLRVAPPEAPVTGYMFGKGIYFADMSSKSANYCYPSQSNNVGLLLLCEVALGSSNELHDADYNANNLPTGRHSTKGLGRTGPDAKNSVTLDGVLVPMGPVGDTGGAQKTGYSLLYNEYVIYNPAQTRMRYLLRVQFNFSPSLW